MQTSFTITVLLDHSEELSENALMDLRDTLVYGVRTAPVVVGEHFDVASVEFDANRPKAQ